MYNRSLSPDLSMSVNRETALIKTDCCCTKYGLNTGLFKNKFFGGSGHLKNAMKSFSLENNFFETGNISHFGLQLLLSYRLEWGITFYSFHTRYCD